MNNDTNQTEENVEVGTENLGGVSDVIAPTEANPEVADILPSTEMTEILPEVIPEVTEAADPTEAPTA